MNSYNIIIIGGGLAGLTNAISLAGAGLKVLLIEKKEYPFHRVCGEYISNEVLPYLKKINVDLDELNPVKISKLSVTSPLGKAINLELDLGGFGVSRYSLDNFLYHKAEAIGASFLTNTKVTDVFYSEDGFTVCTSDNKCFYSDFVIGSYGKRSNLDKTLQRPFFYKRSPYIGVKYHIKSDLPSDTISLHNFKDGYCGVSKVDGDRFCLCYLTSRDNLKKYGKIPLMESKILYQNPFLLSIFNSSEFLFDKPEVINEITFDKKAPVENHIFMSGDSAGMITPLCGNGMAMAIHSAKILSELIIDYYENRIKGRSQLERLYEEQWNFLFESRLRVGRSIQSLFGNKLVTDATIRVLKATKPFAKWLVKQTHGAPF